MERMNKHLVALVAVLLSLGDAGAVRTAPQRTPDLAQRLAAENARMAATLDATALDNTPLETSNNLPTVTVQNPVDTNRAAGVATAVNTPVPNTSGSIGTVTDDVRPADKENTEDLSSLQQEIDQRKNYRNFLRDEIAKLDSKITECEESKGKWKAATVVGSIGVAATGAAALIQALNHKKQNNNGDNDKK